MEMKVKMSDEELAEFKEWKSNRYNVLDSAFWELQRVLDRCMKRKFDETMPVASFRVLANALLALKNEVCR